MRGRPKKNIKRSVRIEVMMSKAEEMKASTLAKKAGISRAAFIRESTFKSTFKSRITEPEILIRNNLVGMANNLNQIARKLNQNIDHYEEVKGALEQVLIFIKENFSPNGK